MAMLSKLIEATGHQLTLNVEPLPGRRLGLPDTPLGRRLRRHRHAVIDRAERRGIRNIRVFGSVARGDEHQGSDIDLLVDVDDGVGLVALAGVARELSDLLGAARAILQATIAADMPPLIAAVERLPSSFDRAASHDSVYHQAVLGFGRRRPRGILPRACHGTTGSSGRSRAFRIDAIGPGPTLSNSPRLVADSRRGGETG